MSDLASLGAKLGHRFSRPELLEQALTHGSVRHEQQTADAALPPVEDNERLEFLGDAIVGMVVGELLYRRYPELDEGALTRLRAALVSRKHLGLVGTGLDLGTYLRLGRAEERNGGRKKPVLLANCMEALIGALYLESGLPAAAAFVQRAVVTPYLDDLRDELRENRAIGDYKTALQELLQSRRAGPPEYLVAAESGPDHRKRFVVEVRVGSSSDGASKAQAEGSTKKKAAQEAARKLYERLIGRQNGQLAGASEYRTPALQAELEAPSTVPTVPEPESGGRQQNSTLQPLATSEPAALLEEEHPKPAEAMAKPPKRTRRAVSSPRPAPAVSEQQATAPKEGIAPATRLAGQPGAPSSTGAKPQSSGHRTTAKDPR